MSGQINLYDRRFLKRRDWLSLDNVAGAAAVVYLSLGLGLVWAASTASARVAEARTAKTELAAVKQAFEAATKAQAERKPSPALVAQVAEVEQLLRRREEIARALESGAVGSSNGFAEHLRGFARQLPGGIWLTGFQIEAGGAMEIRGRMQNPGALPEYIRRLGTEAGFRGRSFAALTMGRGESKAVTAVQPAAAPVPAARSEAIDFVLSSKAIAAGEPKS